MLQTEYVRNLNCNYERVLLEEKPQEQKYQYCILGRGGIKGLLPCSLRYINGKSYLYYDISSKQNIAQLYGSRCIDREWVKDFLWSFRQIRQELERFLLDIGNVLWYPRQIFQDLESNVFSFLYIPYYEGESSFGQLLEFLAEHIDYSDETLADCIYHMYEQLERNGDVYLDGRIFEDAKCLELPLKSEEEGQIQDMAFLRRDRNPASESVSEHNAERREAIGENREDAREKKEDSRRNREDAREKKEDSRRNREDAREKKEDSRRNREDAREKKEDSRKNKEDAREKKEDCRERKQEDREKKEDSGEKKEDRKKIFGIFEGRRKREREVREDYLQDMQRAMSGYGNCAVAEETKYGEENEQEEFGQTIYMEEKPEPEKQIRRLYTPEGKVIAIIDRSLVTIGKKKEEVDVVLEDSSVSRMHARIIRENSRYYIEDLNATNGTFKNGLRLQPYEKRELEEGDEVRFGRKLLVFR